MFFLCAPRGIIAIHPVLHKNFIPVILMSFWSLRRAEPSSVKKREVKEQRAIDQHSTLPPRFYASL